MLSPVRVAIVHPPLTIAEDFIDYPFVADLAQQRLQPRRQRTRLGQSLLMNLKGAFYSASHHQR